MEMSSQFMVSEYVKMTRQHLSSESFAPRTALSRQLICSLFEQTCITRLNTSLKYSAATIRNIANIAKVTQSSEGNKH
jgi:hypothetical protein